MSLQTQGYRFIFRAGRYTWKHQNEVLMSDIDCTDMNDDEFESFVADHPQA